MALSANRSITYFEGDLKRRLPVAAGKTMYVGGFAGRDPAGYIKPFEPGDNLAGIIDEYVNNASGAAGALYCDVRISGDYELSLSGAALKDVGSPVYATADDAIALTGHPDAFIGIILDYVSSGKVKVRYRRLGEKPVNGVGSVELIITGAETPEPLTTTTGTKYHGTGFVAKSIDGAGVYATNAEDGGLTFEFDTGGAGEVALASLRSTNAVFPVDKGITFECKLVVSDKGDNAALDIDYGLGTALTTNSEANIDHADMVQLACFHHDGNSDNILVQSDDNTTDVAAVDTTIDNDSTTDVPKNFKIIVRPTGAVEFWIENARVLSSTTFALLSTAVVAPFVNMEKTSDDTTAKILLYGLRVAGGKAV